MDKPGRLFTFIATPKYREALDKTRKRLKLAAPEGDYLKLIEVMANRVMTEAGVEIPLRVPKTGGKRAGAGRKPKAGAE